MRLRHGAPASLASPQKSPEQRQQASSMDDELSDFALDAETIRLGLQVALAVFSTFELCFWWQAHWMPWTLLLTNGWGWLDAARRFPTLPPGIDSSFAKKQGALFVLKFACMVVSVKRVQFDPFVFIGLVFWNLMMPLVYFLLLSCSRKSSRLHARGGVVAASDEMCDDLGLFLLQFACSPQQQRTLLVRAMAWAQVAAISATLPSSPVTKFTRSVVATLSPKHRKYYRKQAGCRIV